MIIITLKLLTIPLNSINKLYILYIYIAYILYRLYAIGYTCIPY